MKNLEDLFKIYDDPSKTDFTYRDILEAIIKLPEEVRNEEETRSEYLAFSSISWIINNNGNTQYDVRGSITANDIVWWERRALETRNSLLIMCYSGLVYENKQEITGVKPDFKSITKPYAYSIVDVIDKDYPIHPLEGMRSIEHALEMASQIKDDYLFNRAQQVLWKYDHKYSKDETPAYWGRHFKLMTKYLDKYGEYEQKMVNENEERFDRLERNALENGGKTDKFAHLLEEQCSILCDYYLIKSCPDAINSHIERLHKAFLSSASLRGALWALIMIQRIQSLYRKYNLDKEANKLYRDIQNMGDSTLKCLYHQESTTKIDIKKVNAYIDDLLSGTPHEVLMNYLVSNIPNIQFEEQRRKEQVRQSPLLGLIPTTTLDVNGYPMSNIGIGESAEYQKLMYSLYQSILDTAYILHLEIIKMEKKGKINTDIVLESFKDSPLIVKEQLGIWKRGVMAYFDKDYLVSCHLLIPLFESAIRRLVEISGGKILRANGDPKKGNEYISLEGLLDSNEIKSTLSEDIQIYYKNLFTDQNGWNLRNRLSHGLLFSDDFNSTVADRIFHAFMLLSQLKFERNGE